LDEYLTDTQFDVRVLVTLPKRAVVPFDISMDFIAGMHHRQLSNTTMSPSLGKKHGWIVRTFKSLFQQIKSFATVRGEL